MSLSFIIKIVYISIRSRIFDYFKKGFVIEYNSSYNLDDLLRAI